MGKLKVVSKWLGILILLTAIGLAIAESYRQVRASNSAEALNEALEESRNYVLKGQTVEEYFQTRYEGSNGWPAWGKAIDRYGEIEDEFSEKELGDQHGGRIEFYDWAESQFGLSDWPHSYSFTDAQVERLLELSSPLADFARQANLADVIADPANYESGRVFAVFGTFKVLLARVAAHLQLNNHSDAFDELMTCISLTKKMTHSFAVIDHVFVLALRNVSWEWAAAIASKSILSEKQLNELSSLLRIKNSTKTELTHAIEGEILFVSNNCNEIEEHGGRDWFTWISASRLDGDLADMSGVYFPPYTGAWKARDAFTRILLNSCSALQQLEQGQYPSGPWIEEVEAHVQLTWDEHVDNLKITLRETRQYKCVVDLFDRQAKGTVSIENIEQVKDVVSAYDGLEAIQKDDSILIRMVFDDLASLSTWNDTPREFYSEYPPSKLPLNTPSNLSD